MSYFRIFCLFFSFCLVCCLFSHKNLSLNICSLSKNNSENDSLNSNSGIHLGWTMGEGEVGQGYCWHKDDRDGDGAKGINCAFVKISCKDGLGGSIGNDQRCPGNLNFFCCIGVMTFE